MSYTPSKTQTNVDIQENLLNPPWFQQTLKAPIIRLDNFGISGKSNFVMF